MAYSVELGTYDMEFIGVAMDAYVKEWPGNLNQVERIKGRFRNALVAEQVADAMEILKKMSDQQLMSIVGAYEMHPNRTQYENELLLAIHQHRIAEGHAITKDSPRE